MDADEFRRVGKQMVDYVADYMENVQDRPVGPRCEPGYLHQMIPDQAPQDAEKWEDVFGDIERVIMPGITHWQHPNFHAYYPTPNSYPSIVADMLSDGIGSIGFTWKSSPAYTELEVAMMDWLGKMLQLPEEFLSGGKGGGVIQGSASDSTLVALLAARKRILSRKQKDNPDLECSDLYGEIVAYTSEGAHSSVERACKVAGVTCRLVPSDNEESMRGDALAAAIKKDKDQGLLPFFVTTTLGTTSTCAFDNLLEIGPVCNEEGIWLHIDADYAGAAFICPEFRTLLNGVEFADSFNFNPHKWLLVNFDCSTIWFKNSASVTDAFGVDAIYLKHENTGKVPDFLNWQIPGGRRFRSLKMWFVMRLYGRKKMQEHIRSVVEIAKDFEKLVRADPRFEVTHKVTMGLVCFALKNQSNDVNENLLKRLNQDGRIHLVPSSSKGRYFLRFSVGDKATNADIKFAWKVITEAAEKVLNL